MPSPFARRKGNSSGPSVPPVTTTEHNLDIVCGILTIAGLEGIRGRTDVVTVAGLN